MSVSLGSGIYKRMMLNGGPDRLGLETVSEPLTPSNGALYFAEYREIGPTTARLCRF